MADDLIGWLRTQIDEDERVARAAGDIHPEWTYDRESFTVTNEVYPIAARKDPGGRSPLNDVDGTHIARHDPARVLREVQRNRRVLSRHMPTKDNVADRLGFDVPDICGQCAQTWPCSDVRYLAAIFDDRPGFREE